MGPIPLGEGGGRAWCIYIYIYIHMHNIMCILYIYTYINAFRLELTLSTIGNAICPCGFASTANPADLRRSLKAKAASQAGKLQDLPLPTGPCRGSLT